MAHHVPKWQNNTVYANFLLNEPLISSLQVALVRRMKSIKYYKKSELTLAKSHLPENIFSN